MATKPVKGVMRYPLYMYSAGVKVQDFIERAKRKLILDVVDLAGTNEFNCKFTVVGLDPLETFMQTESVKRADGQYTLRGEFVYEQEVRRLVAENCIAVVLDGWIKEGD